METLATSANKWPSKNNDRFQTGSPNTWTVKQIPVMLLSWMGSSSKQHNYLEGPQCLHFPGEIIQLMAYL